MCLIHLASAMDIRSGRRQRMTSLRQRRKQPSLFVADAGVEPRATSSAGTVVLCFWPAATRKDARLHIQAQPSCRKYFASSVFQSSGSLASCGDQQKPPKRGRAASEAYILRASAPGAPPGPVRPSNPGSLGSGALRERTKHASASADGHCAGCCQGAVGSVALHVLPRKPFTLWGGGRLADAATAPSLSLLPGQPGAKFSKPSSSTNFRTMASRKKEERKGKERGERIHGEALGSAQLWATGPSSCSGASRAEGSRRPAPKALGAGS